MKRTSQVISVYFLLVASLACFAIGAFGAKTAYEVSSWPTAQATVVSAEIEVVEKRRKMRTKTYHKPIITYEYEVAGDTYRSDRRTPLAGWSNERDPADAAAIVAELAPGKELTVRYDPEDPATACVENGTSLVLGIGGAGVLLMGLFLFGRSRLS